MPRSFNDQVVAFEAPRGRVRYAWPEGSGYPARWVPGGPGDEEPYDVAVVGAGVVGCALSFSLSLHRLRVVLLDRRFDVGEGTSKANSAIVHTGFDATPGTLESRLVDQASRRWPDVAASFRIPLLRTSALLLALDRDEERALADLEARAAANGVEDVEVLSAGRLRALEPGAPPSVLGGLHVPRESIVDPFTACVALAEAALVNGVDVLLGLDVREVAPDRDPDLKRLRLGQGGELRARWVVNAAGLGAMALAGTYGARPFHTNPRRGQFLVFDKEGPARVGRILLPVPTERTKGMLVAPTIFGNLLAGPTAEDLPPEALVAAGTTSAGLREVARSATRLCPGLRDHPAVAVYAGLRCNCAEGSYQIRFNDGLPGVVTVAGIRSTGLTASISLADHLLAGLSAECGLPLRPVEGRVEGRPDSAWPGWWTERADARNGGAATPGRSGTPICFCEGVLREDLERAIASPLRPCTLDALKRRTRAGAGRCQGFHCRARVAEVLAEGLGVPPGRLTKKGPGSEWASAPRHGAGP